MTDPTRHLTDCRISDPMRPVHFEEVRYRPIRCSVQLPTSELKRIRYPIWLAPHAVPFILLGNCLDELAHSVTRHLLADSMDEDHCLSYSLGVASSTTGGHSQAPQCLRPVGIRFGMCRLDVGVLA